MIPVRDEYLLPFDMKIYPSDTTKQRNYKMHCMEELQWCREHENEITMLAKELHKMVCTGLPFKKRKDTVKSQNKICPKCSPLTMKASCSRSHLEHIPPKTVLSFS